MLVDPWFGVRQIFACHAIDPRNTRKTQNKNLWQKKLHSSPGEAYFMAYCPVFLTVLLSQTPVAFF